MHLLRLIAAVGLLAAAIPALAQPSWMWAPHGHEYRQGPRIGVLVEDLSFDELDFLGLPYGVRVTRVSDGSPADAAGIDAGDILFELDGKALFSIARLRWLIERTQADAKVTLEYYRNEELLSAELEPERPYAPARPPARSHGQWLWNETFYLGVGLQSLTRGLREALSVPDGAGVLITEVYDGGAADRAGLRAGDVIIKMDQRTVRGIDDIRRVLDYFEPGARLTVEIIRDKKKQDLELTLGKQQGSRRPEGWTDSYRERIPFFDPEWWREMEEFTERWRRYWEEGEKDERVPPGSL
jgi:S1-C subfamily serine protease